MKPLKSETDHSLFSELNKHVGSEHYEITPIFNKDYEIPELFLDTVANNLNVYGKTNPLKKENAEHHRRKIDFLGGNILDEGPIYTVLKDGTLWYTNEYNNWIINGDTTKHKYIDPFSSEEVENPYDFKVKEQDPPEKWLGKFKKLYNIAEYIYIHLGMYYLKLDHKWYWMEPNLEGLPDNLEQQYPPKEDQDVRMVELENLAPLWYHEGFKERDTSLIKMIDYESTYYEEKGGLDSYKYSAGWWYLEVYMPLGDTLRIKRYSYFEDPELKLYKIPNEYGGREDVLFIVQKPKDAHAEQVGGMYAIRPPRDPNQPQKRYQKKVYTTDSEGNEILDRSKSIETEEYKMWAKDKS